MLKDLFIFGGVITLSVIVFTMGLSLIFYGIAAFFAVIGWLIEKVKGE